MESEKGVKGRWDISKNCILGIPHYHNDSQPVVNGACSRFLVLREVVLVALLITV